MYVYDIPDIPRQLLCLVIAPVLFLVALIMWIWISNNDRYPLVTLFSKPVRPDRAVYRWIALISIILIVLTFPFLEEAMEIKDPEKGSVFQCEFLAVLYVLSFNFAYLWGRYCMKRDEK